jgi:3-phenylpropionate/trans-cinnamate dioxygenase ferredoxin reductase component
MAARRTFVIVGGGLAGAKAAETLRAEGFDGEVVLVGAEARLPYERPPLSKGYLAGESAPADAEVHAEAFYAEQRIELLPGRTATRLDPGAHRLELDDGTALRYDRLLIASGAVPRRPPIEGADHPGVRVLRTIADADALRDTLRPGARLVILGAGWIGCEVAATARGRGAQVALLERVGTPLEHVLGPELGAFFASVHRARGVELLTGASVASIDAGRRVRLADGRVLEGDAVLLAVGVAPATELAAAAGLAVDDGIVCDERLQTSAPDVFAAGDVASARHPRYGRRVRVEHWANAVEQGAAAARGMLGARESFAALPFFFSDQYDLGLEYVGLHGPGDRLVIRGALSQGGFQAFWLDADDHVRAGLHVNDWDATEPIRALVGRAAPVDPAMLADPSVPVGAAERPATRAG